MTPQHPPHVNEPLREEVMRHRRTTRLPQDRYVDRPTFPTRMMVEVTNACNHRCYFCANPRMERPAVMLSFELYARLVREAAQLGLEELALYSTGEPLLHERFVDMVGEAKRNGIPLVSTTTNGVLFDRPTAWACFEAGLDLVRISINAGDAATYRKTHGRDDFTRVLSNVRDASATRRELGAAVRMRVSCVVTRSNQHTVAQLQELVGDLVDEVEFFPVGPQAGLVRNVAHSQRPDAFIADHPETAYTVDRGYVPCSYPFDRVHLTAEGFLTLCPLDFQGVLRCGDVRQRSLIDAWLSEEYAEMRRCHLEDHLEGLQCHSCVHGDQVGPVERPSV
jgi:MoaA/NifB/PqqE/SkfB family radical SAM enzyme